jgi:small subunit ribosomal protein S20
MPQHQGAVRRVRLSEKRRIENKGKKIEMRNLLKEFDATSTEAPSMLKKVQSKLDRLAAKGLIHKNYAANKKAQLARHIAKAKTA